MFTLHSYPKAIVHIDADSFFTTCEQSLHPEWKGKPIVCGQERGIAAAMSYEAKAKGVKRGMKISEIKKVCPEVILVPSDYETYSLFSKRMFEIMRRYSGLVEEYSIDEAFVDITGLRRALNMSYERIMQKMVEDIKNELGISISAGLAPTKVLAKIASSCNKPNGFVCIPGREIHTFLSKVHIEDVWGIGPQTTNYCAQFGMYTALDFAEKESEWINKHFTKPHQELHQELRGVLVYEVTTDHKNRYVSISKTRTFTPPSKDREYVWGQLAKNIENACIKARRYKLGAQEMVVFLKTQEFNTCGNKTKLARVSCFPHELLPVARRLFDESFTEGAPYRATGVVLSNLIEHMPAQITLFENPLRIGVMERLYDAVDVLSKRYGKHTVHAAATLSTHRLNQHNGSRSQTPIRKTVDGIQEGKRQRIGIPLLISKTT